MRKENAIAKINQYGKIGKVITLIFTIFASCALVGTLIAGIVLLNVPEDLVVFNIDNTARLIINQEEIDPDMSDEDKEMILDAFDSGVPSGLNAGAVHFSLDKAEFTDGKLIASSNGNTTDISLKSLGFAVLSVAVALILTIVSLVFGTRLCGAFSKCESPFEENVIKNINHFAISLLPWALYSSIPESIINSVINNSLKMSISLDLNVIFAVLVIFALSTVFKYGAELQRESDETL